VIFPHREFHRKRATARTRWRSTKCKRGKWKVPLPTRPLRWPAGLVCGSCLRGA